MGIYLLAALIGGITPINSGFQPAQVGIDVYLRSNGVHTDLILPIDAIDVDWRKHLPLDTANPYEGPLAFVAFGWGDRGFYVSTPTFADLKVSTALAALTGLDTTVLHVEPETVPVIDRSTRHLSLSPEQYRRLVAFVDASFQRDGAGQPVLVPGAHYDRRDAFFAARGHYSLFRTCNEWVRDGLVEAGVRAPLWAPFDRALFYQLPE